MKNPVTTKKGIATPEAFKNVLDGFILWKEREKLRATTLAEHRRRLTIFFNFLSEKGVADFSDFQPQILAEFFYSQKHAARSTLHGTACSLREFFRYSWLEGSVTKDMSSYVPSIHVPTEPRLPHGWPAGTVEKLLNAVDRSSPAGKRDYAILMLAARLGLRPGDIRTLTLDHLRWEEARIARCQSKTGHAISLPLTEEVGTALIDYLKNGRPTSTHREVFLQMQPPFNPIPSGNALNKIISMWRVRGGIEFPKEARTSMYALRHSVACRLQEAGTPIETIAAILGHTSTDTTRVYARVDISTLRTVALDPEEVCHA